MNEDHRNIDPDEEKARSMLGPKFKAKYATKPKDRKKLGTHHYYSNEPSTSKQKYVLRLCIKGHFIDLASAGGIFSKDKIDLGTLVLLESLKLPSEGELLDMGTGYGIIGITAAKLKPGLKVTMVDINPTAVKLTRENIESNGVSNAEAMHGDLYSCLGRRSFDAIVSNPPLAAGYGVIFPLIEGAPFHLKEGGYLQIVLRRGVNAIPKKMEAVFGNVELVSRKSGYKVFKSVKVLRPVL